MAAIIITGKTLKVYENANLAVAFLSKSEIRNQIKSENILHSVKNLLWEESETLTKKDIATHIAIVIIFLSSKQVVVY